MLFNTEPIQAANDNQQHPTAAFWSHVAKNQQALFSSKSVAFFPKYEFRLLFFAQDLSYVTGLS
jgi:hypothetical protein